MTAADEYRLLHPIFRKAKAADEFFIGSKFRLIARNMAKINSGKKYQLSRQNRGRIVPDNARNFRRVIVQSHIAKNRSKGPAYGFKQHILYLKRDGAGIEGNRPDLFGRDGSNFNEKDFIERSQKDQRQFRFMISPEDADQLDLYDFTQRFVDQIERDLGAKIDWMASIHHNTDHPHIHLIVRGNDVAGDELFISRDYIAHGMRNRASEMITNELGLRSEIELEKELQKSIQSDHYGYLDKKINQLQHDGIIHLDGDNLSVVNCQEMEFIKRRIEYLSSIGLAKKIDSYTWSIDQNFKEILREKSIQNDIIKILHRDHQVYYEHLNIFDQNAKKSISGVVEKVGIKNELTGQKYAVINTHDGAKYYVELHEKFSAIPSLGDQVKVLVKNPMYQEHAMRYRPRVTIEIVGRNMSKDRSHDREL